MYGIIVCPRCHKVKGVDLSVERSKCTKCGFSIDVQKAKVYYETERREELPEAVRQKEKEIVTRFENGELVRTFDVDVEEEIKERKNTPPPTTTEEGLRLLIERISGERGEFSLHHLKEELGVGEEEAKEILERMLRSGLIYEPREGNYRVI